MGGGRIAVGYQLLLGWSCFRLVQGVFFFWDRRHTHHHLEREVGHTVALPPSERWGEKPRRFNLAM